jgi:hypothetical protein
MATWSTLHIFEYGETQLIGEDFNKKVLTSEITKAQAVIDNIYFVKPKEIDTTTKYHAINIVNGKLSICIAGDTKTWMTDYNLLDLIAIEELVAEIKAYGEVTEEVVIEEASAIEEAPTSEETPTVE